MPSARLAIVCATKWSSHLRGPHASAADRRSRPRRWHDAVAELLCAAGRLRRLARSAARHASGSATADALLAIVDLDTLAAVRAPWLRPRLTTEWSRRSHCCIVLGEGSGLKGCAARTCEAGCGP